MPCHFRLLPFVMLIAACSAKVPGVYQLDIQQGNVLDAPMLARLSPGMEKRKVRFILGTPMIVDTFNQDRWDYVYAYSQGGKGAEQRQITLFFENDRLMRIAGDVHPAEAVGERATRETLVIVPEERAAQGFFSVFEPVFDIFGAKPKDSNRGADAPVPQE